MSDQPVQIAPPPERKLSNLERLGLYAGLFAIFLGIIAWYIASDTIWFALHFGDSKQRIETAKTLAADGASGLTELRILLRDSDPDVRLAAVRGVASLAPETPDALSPLSRMINDENPKVRLAAVRALAAFAESAPLALDQIIALLKQNSAAVRRAAASALPAFGPEAARATVPLIAAGIEWQRSHPRKESADNPFQRAINALGIDIVPGLMAAADDNRRAVRILAAQQLVRLRDAPSARQALQDLITCPFDDVRTLATRWAMNPQAPNLEELSVLIRLLRDETTRPAASEALAAAGDRLSALNMIDADVADELVPILLESDTVPGGVAAKLLAAMGPECVDALRTGLANGSETARLRAVEALVHQGPRAALALQELKVALKHTGIHLPIIRVMGAMGRPGLPILLKTATFRDLEVRRATYNAFARVSIPTPAVLDTLWKGLTLGKDLRNAAIDAFLALGPQGIRRLVRGLRHDSMAVQISIAKALSTYDGDATVAIDALLLAQKRKSTLLRALVVTALGKHGEKNETVRSTLFRMAKDRSVKVRSALATALGAWKRDDRVARLLETLAKDRYSPVRKAAKAALSQ